MKRILVVYNPVSGSKAWRWEEQDIRSYLEKEHLRYDWFTTVPGTKQPLETCFTGKKKFDRIVVIGGDGTVREVTSFLIENNLDIPVGIVPQGSGNILGHSFRLPATSPQRCMKVAIHGKPQAIDVMHVNKQHFALIAAGQGYDAVCIQGATRSLKRTWGILAYLYSFCRTYFFYRGKRFSVTVDGQEHQVVGKVVVAVNFFAVIGLPIDPHLSPRDGLVDVYVFNPSTLIDELAIVGAFLLRKPRATFPPMQVFTGSSVTIAQEDGDHIQLDGEVFPEQTLSIDVLPQAVRVVCGEKFG